MRTSKFVFGLLFRIKRCIKTIVFGKLDHEKIILKKSRSLCFTESSLWSHKSPHDFNGQ